MTTIQILMGVHKGEAFLPAQLQSLRHQTDADWQLLASDDSPDADSRTILNAFSQETHQDVQIIDGPKQGFSANYLHLLRKAETGFLALSDQDDVWLPEKIARGRAILSQVPANKPALYCARVQPWDGIKTLGQPFPPLRQPTGFANALIENVAVGNTILLNPAATALAKEMARRPLKLFAHDWWLYLLVSGVGGAVIHDNGPPVVMYRQHDANIVGDGRGIPSQIKRKRAVLEGAFAERISMNLDALDLTRDRLVPDNARLLDAFKTARQKHGFAKAWSMHRIGVYRQRALGTLGFLGAAALGRV